MLTGIPKLSIKDNRAFAVLDYLGESPRLYSSGSELGFYYNDTRYLGVWETTINGLRPVGLARELRFKGNAAVFSMTNPDLPELNGGGRIPRETFLIRRILTLQGDTVFETLEIKNFDKRPHALQIEQWAGGRFDDVFEVRGFPRTRRGKMLPSTEREVDGQRLSILQYEGLDGQVRTTYVHRLFEAEKIRTSPTLTGYFSRIEIGAKETILLKTVVSFDEPRDRGFLGEDFAAMTVADQMRLLARDAASTPFSSLQIESDNAILNRAVQTAKTDVFMLLTEEPGGLLYPYAGIPWYSAPFGRDGIITAYQMLPWFPSLAKGVLEYAFRHLGTSDDPFTDEQPGKVFHELRRGEMARTREVPFIPYYGSVDSTPLALVLLQEYVRWTRDRESLERWWPEALRALAWIEKWGDTDGDGFLEYAKRSPTGLLNQGWKDSNDSVMHADGVLAQAPIALCEVQGYSFQARMAMASLAHFLGKRDLAHRFRLEALQLRARFIETFWDVAREYVYLALDAGKQPCKVLSSNMGHCLWSEVLSPEQARAVARHLMSDRMFSGYGIRTLAAGEASYNPMSYHNGSIWPHDCSLILQGFRNYGFNPEVERLSEAMIGVLEASHDYRLPELFCGFRKRENAPPVPYEVACKPQAWAAGSIFLMIRSMLGFATESDVNYLVCNSPVLTSKVGHLEVKGLRGPDWEMDLAFRRTNSGTTVNVLRKSGSVRMLTVK